MFGLIFGPVRLVLKIISSLLTLIVVYLGVTFGQIWLTSHHHSTGHAQAILVFGCEESNGTPSPDLLGRLEEALAVYRAHRAPWIAVTGGRQHGDVYTEAGVSATYLERHGVPASRIIVGGGRDTWQNVSSVAPALQARHLTHVITVTDPFHEYRAMAITSAQGLTPEPSPVPVQLDQKRQLWHYYLKETIAVSIGRLVGYDTLSHWTTSGIL